MLTPTREQRGQFKRFGCIHIREEAEFLEFTGLFDRANCQGEDWEYAEISTNVDGRQQKLIDMI